MYENEAVRQSRKRWEEALKRKASEKEIRDALMEYELARADLLHDLQREGYGYYEPRPRSPGKRPYLHDAFEHHKP